MTAIRKQIGRLPIANGNFSKIWKTKIRIQKRPFGPVHISARKSTDHEMPQKGAQM